MSPAEFLSGDWGTTHFRLRWVGGPGRREVRTDAGAARLAATGGDRPGAFRAALRQARTALGAPSHLPVVLSGMAGSSIGWQEVPYAHLPFPLDGRGIRWAVIDDHTLLVSGLRGPSDMMRGEETQALGVAALLGEELPARATLLLPGTHSKHITIADGTIIGFRTHLTGELHDLLGRHSVLRHSVGPGGSADSAAFADGVGAGAGAPLTSTLFRVRTRQVLDGHDPASNADYLSGLLVGAELGTIPDDDTPVVLAADGVLGDAYQRAGILRGLGPRLRRIPADPLAELGQRVALRCIGQRAP